MDPAAQQFTTGEVASLCGVTLRTVINWINRGLLHAYKLPGRRRDNRIPRAELIAFMVKNQLPLPDFLRDVDNVGGARSEALARVPSGQQVLVVDDDMSMAKSIARVVRSIGADVTVATGGFEAGRLYSSLSPALMTLDLQMPKMDGFEVLEALKGRVQGRVLVISAMQDSDLARAKLLGADATLSKPFERGALTALARRLLTESTNSSEG